MYKSNWKVREVSGMRSFSQLVARDIYEAGMQRKIIVACDSTPFVSNHIRRQWNVLIRKVQKERSSTLNAKLILELTQRLAWMQRLYFVKRDKASDHESNILFMDLRSALSGRLDCNSLYILNGLNSRQRQQIENNISEEVLVTVYVRHK
jgi:hypothetical protein